MSVQDNRTKYVNIYDVADFGNYVLIQTEDASLRKECSNCYVMFLKSDNIHYIHNENGKISKYLNCFACGCRIKASSFY